MAADPRPREARVAAARPAPSHPIPHASHFALGSGDVVMAFAIVGIAVLPSLGGLAVQLTAPYAALVVLLWLIGVARLVRATLRGDVAVALRAPLGRFALGTWVAASASTAVLLHRVWPQAQFPVRALLLVAVVIWLVLALEAARALPRLARQGQHRGDGASGLTLLFTVSTQSLVLAGDAAGWLPRAMAAVLVVLGMLAYVGSLAFMVEAYVRKRDHHIAQHAATTHCIVHGAVSITGVALATSGLVGGVALESVWWCAAALFIAVESAEILRLRAELRRRGLHLFTRYRVSQWVRVFTFGMFVAFTAQLAPQLGIEAALTVGAVAFVLHALPPLTLTLLTWESALGLLETARQRR